MRRLALVLAVLSSPLAAFEPMKEQECRDGWASFSRVFVAPGGAENRGQESRGSLAIRVTDDGWCRISGQGVAGDALGYATLDWQTEPAGDAEFPLALRVRIDDARRLDTSPPSRTDLVPPPPVDVALTLRRVPAARQLIVEQVRVTSPAGDDLRGTAVLDRVDLSTPGMAQMSLGSVALRQVNAKVRLNGWVESQILPNLSVEIRGDDGAIREAARGIIADLARNAFGVEAIQNLYDLVYDLPAPRGDLELSMRSESGIGIMQIAVAGLRGVLSVEGSGEVTLDGVRFDVIWTPDPDQTE